MTFTVPLEKGGDIVLTATNNPGHTVHINALRLNDNDNPEFLFDELAAKANEGQLTAEEQANVCRVAGGIPSHHSVAGEGPFHR